MNDRRSVNIGPQARNEMVAKTYNDFAKFCGSEQNVRQYCGGIGYGGFGGSNINLAEIEQRKNQLKAKSLGNIDDLGGSETQSNKMKSMQNCTFQDDYYNASMIDEVDSQAYSNCGNDKCVSGGSIDVQENKIYRLSKNDKDNGV